MILLPTNVTIQGRRVWLQDATAADIEYVNYRVSTIGPAEVLMAHNDKLPKAERIDSNATTKTD